MRGITLRPGKGVQERRLSERERERVRRGGLHLPAPVLRRVLQPTLPGATLRRQ